ncbi:hypothetical protein Slin15195_G038590 [Septoria linicola]|uniref:Uncharacterized protein n=1 Tax=Septoria linicola TaxID=215465 RepID=A0A9Q9AK73_9PEZI|nr:hypothetical protein Slin15195_G038590 [Septoria linicola]
MPVQMGNSTSTLINKSPGSHSTRREVEDVLNRLVVLSEVKATTHYQRVIKSPIDADILPIERIVRRLHVVHCGIKQNADVVSNLVEEYLGQYFKTEILEGLTAIICQTLDRLISSTSDKNSSEMTSYAITIARIWMSFWKIAWSHR